MSTERLSLKQRLEAQKNQLLGRFRDVFGHLLQYNYNDDSTLLRHDNFGVETKDEIGPNFDFATENFFDALVWKHLLQLYISKTTPNLVKAVHIIKYENGTFGVMVSNLDSLNGILTREVLTQVYDNYRKLMSQETLSYDNEIDALERILRNLKTSSGFFPAEESLKLQQQLLVRLRSSLDAKTKQLQQMVQELKITKEPLARKKGELKRLQNDIEKMSGEIDAKKKQLQLRESTESRILELRVDRIAATLALQKGQTTNLSAADCEKELAIQEQKLKKLPTSAEIEQWIEIAKAIVEPRQKTVVALTTETLREQNRIDELEKRVLESQNKLDSQEKEYKTANSNINPKLQPSADEKEKERKAMAQHSRKDAFFVKAFEEKAKTPAPTHKRKTTVFYAPAAEKDDTNPDITTKAASSASKTEAIVEAASSAPKTEATIEATSSASLQSRGYRS